MLSGRSFILSFPLDPLWRSVSVVEINVDINVGVCIVDAIFPTVPKWFTAPLHATSKRPSALFPDGTSRSFLPEPPVKVSSNHWHDHALLEHLFMSVFENRFLNRTPSCESHIPHHLHHQLLTQNIIFPSPPPKPLHSSLPPRPHAPHTQLPHAPTRPSPSAPHGAGIP